MTQETTSHRVHYCIPIWPNYVISCLVSLVSQLVPHGEGPHLLISANFICERKLYLVNWLWALFPGLNLDFFFVPPQKLFSTLPHQFFYGLNH